MTDYQPTTTEERLLEVLLDPTNRLKSITEICQLAKCSRQFYYESFKKPEFAALVEEKTKELITRTLPQVMTAFIREAQRGSFQHGKLLLEMARLYVDRKELTGPDGGPIAVTWAELIEKSAEEPHEDH